MSLTKRIIPCLDIDDGRVVKGTNFVNIVDAGDPVEVAQRYDVEGADEIAFLDITATHQNRKTIIKTVEKVAGEVFIPLTVGGGVSNYTDVLNLLNAGADKVAINSAAVDNPDLINNVTDKIGRQCIVAAMDVKKEEENKWVVYTHGGRKKTSLDALTWAIELDKRGAGEILLTSMDRDGTKKGFDTNLLKTISNHVDIPVIASGGAGELEHLKDAIVLGNADAVLAASIFHYSIFSIKEVKDYFKDNGVMVRS
ncbi:MAG: imidazole glycerol phosphate synthase subunit HisF [Gammaproteobacteria bacterium]|jgi:cyclase|nr:imidazole glycerol phosphate synthase subunit HisF [Gammaproteobacteria bacterium]|tara:strand:- start:5472 stop:6233 length:762 start_codon:yes stop_codon:yes gene_type:complete